MPAKRSPKGKIQVRPEDSFDRDHLPGPDDTIKTVFSLRLDDAMVANIDRAREVYAERIAAAVRRPSVVRESRSAMIRILIEDGLRVHGVLPPQPTKGGTK